MLTSGININQTAMKTTVFNAQYLKPRAVETTENNNTIHQPSTQIQKQTEAKKILPVDNINVIYIASALHRDVPVQRGFKSIWA